MKLVIWFAMEVCMEQAEDNYEKGENIAQVLHKFWWSLWKKGCAIKFDPRLNVALPWNKKSKPTFRCNCLDKNGCSLNGKCRIENICKCISLTKNNVKTVYLDVSAGELKKN